MKRFLCLVLAFFITSPNLSKMEAYANPAKVAKPKSSSSTVVRELSDLNAGDLDRGSQRGSSWIELATQRGQDGKTCSLIVRKNPLAMEVEDRASAIFAVESWFEQLDPTSVIKAMAYETDAVDSTDFWPSQVKGFSFLSAPTIPWNGRSDSRVAFLLSCEEIVEYANPFGKKSCKTVFDAFGTKGGPCALRSPSESRFGWHLLSDGRIKLGTTSSLILPALWVDSEIFVRRPSGNFRLISPEMLGDRSEDASSWLEIATYSKKEPEEEYSLIIRLDPLSLAQFVQDDLSLELYSSSLPRNLVNDWFSNFKARSNVVNIAVLSDACTSEFSSPIRALTRADSDTKDIAFLLSEKEYSEYFRGFVPGVDISFTPRSFLAVRNFEKFENRPEDGVWSRTVGQFGGQLSVKYLTQQGNFAVCQGIEKKRGVQPAMWIKSSAIYS
ncbi:MAG: hypothetical protein LBF33_03595 [Oscillospiraceae bacterium]|jgi:hypothetical protein|nr:hypothetical protein [Oscillospiraceae bacterium]